MRVFVICTGNRARSQMAHGWLRALGGGRVDASSAGTEPKGVHPIAVEVMQEVGIDISSHTSDHVDRYIEQGDDGDFDLILTVCDSAGESCPVIPGARRTLHRSFEDPDDPELSLDELREVFRRTRDEIGEYCSELVADILE